MSVLELVRMAWRAMWSNRLRAILTMLGMIIGVMGVILLSSVGNGARDEITVQVQKLGSNLLIVLPQAVRRAGVDTGGAQPLTYQEAQLIKMQDHAVASVAPQVSKAVQVVYGAQNYQTTAQGTTANLPAVQNMPLQSGRFFTPEEVQRSASVAVVGSTVVQNLFPRSEPALGKTIAVNGLPFTIIGVLQTQGSNGLLNLDDRVVVPVTTEMNMLTGNQNLSAIYLTATSSQAMNVAEGQVTATLSNYLHVGPGQSVPFRIFNEQTILNALGTITSILSSLLAGVAAISLVVGGIGIMNIMLVSVTERTAEIGLRKAVGATRSAILRQFVIEAIMLSSIGGLIGAALGIGCTLIGGLIFHLGGLISWPAVIIALLFALAVGVVFGVYPARQAARLNPIEALRFE